MSIAPIVHIVHVRASPDVAFGLFASRMGDWWPRGKTLGSAPHAEIMIEPHVGGRWFERDDVGNEVQWGKVLGYNPPTGLLLAWQVDSHWTFDPEFSTEVELTFTPTPDGGTSVRLEHRQLERFGANAAAHAAALNSGWPDIVAQYALYSDNQDKVEKPGHA